MTGLVSHEKLIEERKADYYLALNKTQSTWKTDAEDVYPWMTYFLGIVKAQATAALAIIQEDQADICFQKNSSRSDNGRKHETNLPLAAKMPWRLSVSRRAPLKQQSRNC